MADQDVSAEAESQEAQAFLRSLLSDLTALEALLDAGAIESGVRRIGAEQEMFLVDREMRPAPVAAEVMRRANEPRLTHEIGLFNLEANVSPRVFAQDCLREMEAELEETIAIARAAAQACGADIVLCGILPTIRHSDLTLDNLTPNPRYVELNRVLMQRRGGDFQLFIKGLDELRSSHDSLMPEAACTSFQVHFQVGPAEFVRQYNLAQAAIAPVLAAATNSPLLLGQRLWAETRIALFQHAVDDRSAAQQQRGSPTRVSFGDGWLRGSVLEYFREEIARFRVVLTRRIEDDSLAAISRGELPQLAALRLHNSTVWRWNRPCYGIQGGRAHLRVETRALPAGPTVVDEMANAAFFFGLMVAMPHEYGPIEQAMSFDAARANFVAAARQGLRAQFDWLGGKSIAAARLILEHLLPLARSGLAAGLAIADVDRFLGVLEERVKREQTGSLWAIRSLAAMGESGTQEQRHRALTAAMLAEQQSGRPVAQWPPAALSRQDRRAGYQRVEQYMATDLFTVRADDLVDLAACVMSWRHVRHVPVEDDAGHLLGLVSHRDLLRLLATRGFGGGAQPVVVREIMKANPVSVAPETLTADAIRLMREKGIGCLPVVRDGRLVGIVTASDFLELSAVLFEEHLRNDSDSG
jgi:CBS domain-containing protein